MTDLELAPDSEVYIIQKQIEEYDSLKASFYSTMEFYFKAFQISTRIEKENKGFNTCSPEK